MRFILIFIPFVFFACLKSNAQKQSLKTTVPFCDSINQESLLYNPDTSLYKKQLINADKKICKEIILSTYRTPPFIKKYKGHIIKNHVYDKEEEETKVYFLNKQKTEMCEIAEKDNFKKNYLENAFQPRRIKVFKFKRTKVAPIKTECKNFVTENNIRLGITRNVFFRIKTSSIFKIENDSLKNRITYYYSVQIFCKKEADWLFGASYYGAGYPVYSCYYTFDLTTNTLIEYSISM